MEHFSNHCVEPTVVYVTNWNHHRHWLHHLQLVSIHVLKVRCGDVIWLNVYKDCDNLVSVSIDSLTINLTVFDTNTDRSWHI